MSRSLLLVLVTAMLAFTGCETDNGGKSDRDSDRQRTRDRDRDRDTTGTGTTDREFVRRAASGGMLEVEAARLALDRSNNNNVRSLARHILDDHQQANRELMRIAERNGMNVPSQMTASDRQVLSRLEGLRGREFNEAYMDQMVAAHQRDIREFESASRNADDRDLRDFAERTLPTLREHLRMVQDARRDLMDR